MNNNFVIFAYFLASLIVIAVFATGLSLLVDRNETKKYTPLQAVLYKDTAGNLKYASGTCVKDTDCQPTGCSMELCASENIFSTCEVKEDMPDTNVFSCLCNEGLCAWAQK